MVLNCLLYVSCWLAEGASEEPGDEGADGSDEEPSVGRQRYVDTEEMTLYFSYWSFFWFFFEGGVSLLKTSPTQRLITRRWRGECWIFSLRWLTTPLLVLRDWDTAEEQLPFLLGHMGTVLWLPLMRTTIMSSRTQAPCMRQWFLSAIHSFITSVLRFTLDIRFK